MNHGCMQTILRRINFNRPGEFGNDEAALSILEDLAIAEWLPVQDKEGLA